jgi:predicted RNase H-like HicB family nuclease
MIAEYIQAAMRKAKYELLEGNEGFYGEIPGFQGVWANAPTLEACRDELAEVLEEWILFHLSDGTSLPILNGMDLNVKKVAEPALL